MSTPTPLPARNKRSAPKFDPDFEEQLPIFFGEFEAAAKAAAIHNDPEKMKKEVLWYVDAKTMRFWRSLLTFKDDTKSWDEFKTKVLENYPDALQQTDATTVDLDKVIETYRKSGISNSKELGKYHREFSVVSNSLVKNGIISGIQAAKSYVSVFPELIQSRLDMHLQVQFPNKKKGEAYTLTQLKSSVDYLLSDASIPTSMANFRDGFYVAKDSHSIRGINATIGERTVHCVLDSGCSIVAMSNAACNTLGIAFDPEQKIPLQSTNGSTDWSRGLAKDVPFHFGDVLAFLQVQVVDSPAYNFLLGRPFEILIQANVWNFLSGDQHLSLTDPNTHKTVTILTLPRDYPQFKKGEGQERGK
ncbi:hypothetical protein GYMLUDRAFT_982894 [Collybiopsis luxurians FD-317 M1]|uniref:Uncharacterized protein n=1 Tax=Collybiopsis luxurians FD-317 M1 TaxID=944289 RepID=A0A0D0ALI9_9AGAR|nr:hypothetical protein GYMLUDRAFT_982894 [Collybiopsis luxurians FD-317 M1]